LAGISGGAASATRTVAGASSASKLSAEHMETNLFRIDLLKGILTYA
jgi:hypothetical protein